MSRSTLYANALTTRLADIRTQRELARATDAPLAGVTTGGPADLAP